MNIRNLLITLLLMGWSLLAAAQSQVTGFRMWPAPDNTRLVFELSGPVEHSLFALDNPDRLVLDIKDAKLKHDFAREKFDQTSLSRIRSGVRNGDDLRIVLDLNSSQKPKSFLLRPNKQYGYRLVLDLKPVNPREAVKAPVVVKNIKDNNRDVIVAIDAGHGGEDPGAMGPRKTREKDVVLAIARKLEALVAREKGMRPVMIRTGDYYVGLKDRVEKARKHKADLFISIHADAFDNPRARGASVYTLSSRGASSEQARLLAQKENEADLVGGVSLDDKDELLASVLLDLSQTASREASDDVAGHILKKMGGVAHLHKKRVEKAGFRVLKSPDVPSILVETAFISNPGEEKNLRSSAYQQKLASAIMGGVRSFFYTSPPPGTYLAKAATRRHIISRGDTLSGIAQQYRVSTNSLRRVNGLTTSVLQVGQVLEIPVSGS